jgi:hypothetical protein
LKIVACLGATSMIVISAAFSMPDSIRYYTSIRKAEAAISQIEQYRLQAGHLPATLAETGWSARNGRAIEYWPSCCPERAHEYSVSFHISDVQGLSWDSRTRSWKRVMYELCLF